MTKEELKQEAREKYHNHKIMEFQGFYNRHYYYLGYLDSAEPREKRIAELEKEIAELDCQKNRNKACFSCANATERCFKNEIGCPCEKYKSYKDENAELKKQQFSLRNERNTFLAQNEQYEKDLINFNENLTKAKEIIKKFLEFVNNEVEFDPEHPQEHTDLWNELCEKAAEFLNSEVEK